MYNICDEIFHKSIIMKQYQTILNRIGCNTQQVSMFELLWRYGAKPAGTIAKLVGIERTHVYKMLDQMVSRGIVAKSKQQGATSFYIPSDTIFDQYYEAQQAIIDQSKAVLPQVYHELAEIGTNSVGHKPLYRIWEGRDGMTQLIDTIIHQIQSDELSVIKIIALSTLQHSATTSTTFKDYAHRLFEYCKRSHINISSTVGT